MNTYTNKKQWKYLLFLSAIVIGVLSLTYTNILVKKLAEEERKKVELWAEGTKQLIKSDANQEISFIVQVIRNNKTVPVILTDENDNINAFRNLDSIKSRDEKYLQKQLRIMKEAHEPIEILLPQGHKNYIYYKDSIILTQLMYFPYVQLTVISLFILVSYFAFSYSRKSEQNRVWVGLAKETAHQLGTPISSLIGWIELLKISSDDQQMVSEMEKDLTRLQLITERFSKIGSQTTLNKEVIQNVLSNAINYIKSRVSNRVNININFPTKNLIVPVNPALFEWVIENICKNAVDAMNGQGDLSINLIDNNTNIFIDISDSGKGMQKAHFKTIFKPGYLFPK